MLYGIVIAAKDGPKFHRILDAAGPYFKAPLETPL